MPSKSKISKSILSYCIGLLIGDKITDMPGAESFLVRLCLAGPLLYVGLQMILQPAQFLTSLRTLASSVEIALQNFQQALRQQEPFRDPNSVSVSSVVSDGERFFVRVAGMVLVLFSVAFLSGLAG